jgi:hypothetical protein
MSTNREPDPLPIQYLGESGHTYPCVRAMVTIMTSPYRCREITVVFREQPRGEDSTDVCFVIWDWLGCEITIVPDGFGTHSGTGGWGLAVALSLIQFYQIPLKEKWIETDQFERIANGYPTDRDCEQLHQADFGAPSWPYFQHDFGSLLWSQIRREASQFPYWLMEPELLNDIKDVERNPGSAVFQALRRLVVLIRYIGAYPAERIGQPLINEAMGTGKPLEPHGATPDERLSWANLFRGAIGAFKNPESHRDQQLKLEDAIGQILAVNMLLRKLKQDFPDKFRKAEPTNSEDEEDV